MISVSKDILLKVKQGKLSAVFIIVGICRYSRSFFLFTNDVILVIIKNIYETMLSCNTQSNL